MKKLLYIGAAVTTLGMASCSLDETNYSSLDKDKVYTTQAGMNAIVNSCYENVYYMYGKVDGIDLMEMGTDLWKNGSRNGGHGDLTNYNENLTPSSGTIKTIWNALYAIVGYCNTAIAYQNRGVNFTEESVRQKVAEAYFLRGFANFHIVEQWGGVVLQTESFAQSGISSENGYRSSEEDFYELIIKDLTFAKDNLPLTQAERGRATRKAAYAMLAKAYLQRTRLYPEGSEERKKYAELAFQTATELIDHARDYNCGLYASTATKSGDAIMWDGENNKNNSEILFTEAVDHESAYNPEGWNRGRTSQYYMMKISSQAQNFGVQSSGLRYGRDNATVWSPTLYLLTECFEPKLPKTETNAELINLAKIPDGQTEPERTADTRFEQAFYYKYYGAQLTMQKDVLARYKKDIDDPYFSKMSGRRIASSLITGANLNMQFPGANFYAATSNSTSNYEREDIPDALACYTPNWELDPQKTAVNKRLCVGISDYFNMEDKNSDSYGGEATYTYFRNLFPSWKKWHSFKYVYTNQYCMMDIPIIRLTDVYLIAAEASITAGHPADGLKYLNAVRRHAAVAGDATEMDVTLNEMTIDYILKERARELCGEQWRWYDLKRTGRLTSEYLSQKGMNPFITTFDNKKHTVRPVPQQFLDQIANPDEFGTNGY
ncbi:MAG: RagB/SusD family nutrient uptake outer membrane protein [Bacteroidales bacterium]|nr:RagB/SusD family nutrient uptake outer membrane protein [Bacteroidales bacterium]MCM1146269.1 RagB/SusD family nutrient uptake outer membrane protein [Bacteroidales bacterium]MCM1205293.1 RagB/SusD family nutrient uptake outer membrane protein [Bacillota bacterium]MCM1509620.1 RagB/SusD family nutrient uptake outer membrane protein [Clostridium sp.]